MSAAKNKSFLRALDSLIEFYACFQKHHKWVMLQFQYVYSEPFRAMKPNAYEATKLVFGVNVNLNPKWRK